VASFKDTLKDAVRQLSFKTSLDSLKKKGVQQVSVLGLDRIIALIEAAVHRSLKSRLVGIEREAVADATKAEFLRLLRSNEDLQRQKSEVEDARERAEDEIDTLRRELAQNNQALQLKLEQDALALANRYEGENAVIAKKVAAVVAGLAQSAAPTATSVEQRLMELVMDVVSGERQSAEEARRALHDREVDNLQRRIKKLNDNLAVTEQRLQQVAALKDVEGGISSVYREVQGLAAGDGQLGKKKELMADIFKANLKLQKKDKPGA
jgi:prefoldin subunit 5